MARGLPSIRRVNARNYIQEEADQRLREVIAPYQKQGLNALGVDSYDVLLFLKKASTVACTCRETQMTSDLGQAKDVPTSDGIAATHEISIDWRRPLFGEPHEARFEEEDGTGMDDYEFDESPTPHANNIFESSPDCGICYRSGYVPGFVQYGKQRIVLTTHDVVGYNGSTIDRNSFPHAFDRLASNGWVEFEFVVPKYFKTARYSVRNNLQQVEADITTDVGALDLAFLRANNGKAVRIKVSTDCFTHLVFTFDMGSEVISANIAQMSKQTDWTMFNTIGNLNVILPMTIPEVTNGSIIVVPKPGITLVITDVTYLRPEDGRNLDWSVNTRVCQPQEPAQKISNSLALL
jgi:hypothetical protein